ncbi:MAG TPA: CHASE3 domain-containing protein [Bryobacteraceae bacterium]|nr:CHASE3 domain-containing protein [Bryobacteraceae bacterium]
MQLTIKSRVRLGFLLGLAAVFAMSLFALWSTLRWREDVDWIARSKDVISRLDRVLEYVEDSETGQRGFLLTGKDAYLEDYRRGLEGTRSNLDGLMLLSADNSDEQRSLGQVRQELAVKFNELAIAIDLRQREGLEAAQKAVMSERGKEAMDRIRKTVGGMQEREYDLLAKRLQSQQEVSRIAQWCVALGGALALLLGWLALGSVERSLSSRDRAHALLEKSEHQLRDQARLLEIRNAEVQRATELKSEFLANMSHEMRTPLTTVLGFSEVLSEELEGPLNEKQKHFAELIHRDAMHLLNLVNDILDLSKIEAGRLELERETFEVVPAVEEVLSSIRPRGSSKSIDIAWQAPPALALEADRVRFKQVMYNLLTNAVKFTPAGGHVRIGAAPKDSFVEISVADTGVGIPKEQQTAIFDPFYQAAHSKLVHEGTGLGLAITKRLVEQHGGRLWLESDPGKGSLFTFTLPRAAETPAPVAAIT